MTSKRIDDLPLNDPLAGTEFIHIVQNGNSRKVPAALLLGGGGAGGVGAVTQLVAGGGVAWESGYTFRVSAAVYLINGLPYQSVEQTVTLDAANGANDRIDILALNTDGTLVKITGSAVALPFEPDVDPSTQLALTSVTVVHATTQPPTTDPAGTGNGGGSNAEIVYAENVEWTTAVSNARWNAAAVSHPQAGVKHIKGTALNSGDYIRLTKAATFTASAFSSLRLFVESFAAKWGTGRLILSFMDANDRQLGSTVSLRDGTYGLKTATLVAYQQVLIPMSAFGLSGTAAPKKLNIRWAGGSQTVNIDAISLVPSGATSGSTSGLDQAAADSRYLNASDNLADLVSALAARANLSVYSKAEIDAIVIAAGGATTGEIAYVKPTLATFPNQRPATGTIEASSFGVRIRAPGTLANNNSLHYATRNIVAGAGGYRATARFRFGFAHLQWTSMGLVLRASGTGAAILFSRQFDGTDGFVKNVYTSDTAFSTTAGLLEARAIVDYWLRFTDNGVNRDYEISYDGEKFYRIFREATNTSVTPNQVGIYLNPNAGSVFGNVQNRVELGGDCISWLFESLP